MVHEESEHFLPHRSLARRRARGRIVALHYPKTFDLTLFDQTQVWVERDGTCHPITQLDASSRQELAAWLRRNARHFYIQVLHAAFTDSRIALTGRVPEMVFQAADQWMSDTALVKALEAPDD